MAKFGQVLLILLAAVLAGPAPAADPFEAIRETIRAAIDRNVVPSLSVAVARDGEIVWEEGFGRADRENKAASTPHVPYSIASISKPITATGLMILVERGLVDLGRPVNDYLGEAKVQGYAGDASRATVKRVASHTAGLPLHYHFFLHNEPYPRPPMDETIRRYGILVTKPGEKYQYSNLGYGILDYVIERVSGKAYPQFMREEVFGPLGMTRTRILAEPDPEFGAAVRYWDGKLSLPFYDFDHRGGSAVFASAHDLVRFGMFHLKTPVNGQERILSSRSIELMQEPIAEAERDDGGRYGIGWTIFPDRGGYRLLHHGGAMGGVRTNLWLVPEKRIAVAVLANTYSRFVDEVSDDILGTLLPGYTASRARSTSVTGQEKSDAGADVPTTRKLPRGMVGTWAGSVRTYKGQIPFTLWISDSGVVEGQLGSRNRSRVRNAEFQDGYLTGDIQGDIGTEDANRRKYFLRLSLKFRGSVLNGAVTALSTPGPQLGNALTSWAELKKQRP